MADLITRQRVQATVRIDGLDVALIVDGQRKLSLPWESALQLAAAIRYQAKLIEEQVKHEKVINDQAILFGHGIPIGLAIDPRIRHEARKLAVNEKKLRKQGLGMGGIESTEHVGAPTIIQHPPKKEVKGNGK